MPLDNPTTLQMPIMGFTAKRPHTCLLRAAVREAGGAVCRLQPRKLRHGLLVNLLPQ